MIMPHTPRLQLALLAALATVACQASPPTPHFALAPQGGSLVVRVAPQGAPYRAQYLPVADWDWVEGVLTHAKPGTPEVRLRAEAAIDADTGRRAASLAFAGLRPGAGYRLTVTLYRANGDADPVVVSTETLEAPEILAGLNTLTLTRLFKQTAPVGEAPGSLLKGMVTSLPESGIHARLDWPSDVVVDAQGVVYVADTSNGTIRRLAADAQGRWWMTMLAGTGYPNNTDGELHRAALNGPSGLALAGDGTIFVAEAGRKGVRRVTFDALGIGKVKMLTVTMAPGETATALGAVTAIAVGPGGVLYAAEATRIYKLTPAGGDAKYTATTYAGGAVAGYEDGSGTQAKFKGLRDMAVDADGVIFASDALDHRIRRIAPIGGVGSASTLPMPAGTFSSPAGLTFDAEGRLIVGDARRLYRVTPDAPGAPLVEALAGATSAGFADGVGGAARFNDLSGLAPAADGGFWVADKLNHRVRKVTPTEGQWHVITRAGDGIAGRMNGPTGTAGPLVRPTGVAIAADGTIVIADVAANKLMAIDPAGAAVRVLAGTGAAASTDGIGATAAFNAPSSVSRMADGSFLVVDTGSGALRRLRLGEGGQVTVSTIATGFQYPGSAVEGPDGALYVAESGFPDKTLWKYFGKHRISRVLLSASGAPTITVLAGDGPGVADGSGSTARFSVPAGMTFGPDGALYVADVMSHRIRRITFDPAGQATVTTLAGSSLGKTGTTLADIKFDQPSGLAFDPQGRLVVADYFNHRLQALSLGDGTVSTIAGTTDGYSDGPVAQARFFKPIALAFNAAGQLIVAEDNTYGVRKVTP
jgi:sugar lactone lactonase YvrE